MNTATQLLERCKATINELWAIIDDIDSYGDMAKDDDKLFRKLVERRQLDRWNNTDIRTDGYSLTEGIAADIEAYLAKQQVEQEPVGYVTSETINGYNRWTDMWKEKREPFVIPIYTSPQAREPLSEDTIQSCLPDAVRLPAGWLAFARAIEAHHGIK
jgi:hypothetical protein